MAVKTSNKERAIDSNKMSSLLLVDPGLIEFLNLVIQNFNCNLFRKQEVRKLLHKVAFFTYISI